MDLRDIPKRQEREVKRPSGSARWSQRKRKWEKCKWTLELLQFFQGLKSNYKEGVINIKGKISEDWKLSWSPNVYPPKLELIEEVPYLQIIKCHRATLAESSGWHGLSLSSGILSCWWPIGDLQYSNILEASRKVLKGQIVKKKPGVWDERVS